jgi:phage shock protein C
MATKSNSAPAPDPVRRLTKSGIDRMIGGVCGGIADYLNLPAAAVRLACVFLTFVSGWTAVLYLAALAVMPADPDRRRERADKPARSSGQFWGLLLIGLGLLLLSGWISDQWEWWGGPFGAFGRCWHPIPFRLLFPLLVILTGIGLWIRGLNEGSHGDRTAAAGRSGKKNVSGSTWVRTPADRVIAGVCGGLAERFRVDATLIRLAAVLFALVTAVVPAVLFYVCLWIVLPNKK